MHHSSCRRRLIVSVQPLLALEPPWSHLSNDMRGAGACPQFIGNKATKFNGQIGYNPTTYPKTMGASVAGKKTTTGAGCPQPLTTESTFSGVRAFCLCVDRLRPAGADTGSI